MPLSDPSRLRRRALLRALAALPGVVALQAGCGGETKTPTPPAPPAPPAPPSPQPPPPFLYADEQQTLAALADAILPPDDTPGGAALGAVAFIERLLTAFDVSPPAIFAGGPFSNRNAFPDANGDPSKSFPPNDFATFLPLDRYNEAAWRLTIYGSSGVPGGGPNDTVAGVGPVVGWRDTIKDALAQAVTFAGGPLEELSAAEVAGVYRALGQDARDLLYDLVSEAAFSAPEYGGNVKLEGWKLAHFEGDVMPLGFSQYDPATKKYKERPDAPVSMPNPGPDPEPVTADTWSYVEGIVAFLGGMTFP